MAKKKFEQNPALNFLLDTPRETANVPTAEPMEADKPTSVPAQLQPTAAEQPAPPAQTDASGVPIFTISGKKPAAETYSSHLQIAIEPSKKAALQNLSDSGDANDLVRRLIEYVLTVYNSQGVHTPLSFAIDAANEAKNTAAPSTAKKGRQITIYDLIHEKKEEKKTDRIAILLKPSAYDQFKALATSGGLQYSELARRLIDAVLHRI